MPHPVHEDAICEQAHLGGGLVALTDVLNHLELIARDETKYAGDRYAAQGALNTIKVLAEQANVDTSMLGVKVYG